ncbi:MAG: MBL fold metallo-hydrolase [Candidatus Korarchaeota archaeon]
MRIRILGTGDTMGLPRLWCNCPTCDWARRNHYRRTRFSILIDDAYLIDAGPDIKYQLEQVGPKRINVILVTHAHFDHIGGLPELERVVHPRVYATPETISYIKRLYHYLSYSYMLVRPYKEFYVDSLKITPFLVDHPAPTPAIGYIIFANGKKIAVTSDTRRNLPQESMELLKDLDLLITDAFTTEERKIPKHMNITEARELAKDLNAKKTVFLHASHLMPPPPILRNIAPEIPDDGFVIEI